LRRALLAGALLVLAAAPASAEWQVKPFIAGTYGGDTTFLFVQQSDNHGHVAFGVSGLWLGEIFGLEGDWGHTPSFFEGTGAPLVTESGVTTLTGNVVVAVPRRLAQYTLRPYVVGGAGIMHVRYDTILGLQTLSNLQVMDLGGGVTGFLTQHVGVSWDVRYFRSVDRTREQGSSFTSEHLSFWRLNMAVAIRL
jgi:Outer membrane protein beta-barrel domain